MPFDHPLILLAILPALALLFWLVRRKDWFAVRRRRVLIITSLAVTAIVAALAGPSLRVERGELPTVLLVTDDSPSMRTAQPWPQAARMVRDALTGDTRFGIVSFSGDAQVVVSPARREATPITVPSHQTSAPATNIEQALRTAMAVAGDASHTALLLYSDGCETEGRALAAAAEARERGLRLYVLAPARLPGGANASLVDLQAPSQVRPGEKAAVRVAVSATADVRATVTLQDLSTPAATPVRVDVDLQRDRSQWLELPLELTSPGMHSLEVVLSGVAGDTVPEDDRWPLAVQVGDRRPVLVVYYQSETEGEAAPRPALPMPADFPAPMFIEAAHLPLSAAELGVYAAVILDDVPAGAIADAARGALVEYVRDMGGGLVALGGDNSFGLGGYPRTVIDDLLPVRSEPDDRPPVRVVVLLDRSASMGQQVAGRRKLDLAKEAVLQLATLFNDQDRAGLVLFNHEHQVTAESVGVAGWDALRRDLGAARATGGTEIGPALQTALRMIADTPAASPEGRPIARHIIAVSDGIVVGDEGRKPFDPAALAARARELKASISVVQTGQSSAWPGLRELAEKSGGKFYDVSAGLVSSTGRNRLERILLEDLDLPVLETQPAAVARGPRAPLWPADAALGAVTDVPRYLVTEAKQRAATHLSAGEKKRPLLATWPYGLGRAVAWPVPRRDDGAAWFAQPSVADAYLRSVAWAARGPVAEADYDVTILARGGQLAASVEQRDVGTRPAAAPRMVLRLAGNGAGAAGLSCELEPVAAGRWTLTRSIPAGVYAYSLAASWPEAGATATDSDAAHRVIRRGWLSTGPAAEFRRLDNDMEQLTKLAAAGGGEVLRSPGDAATMVVPVDRRVAIWPYLAGLAGVLLLWEATRELRDRRR
jgi:Mg-chelatase subunit ChlD